MRPGTSRRASTSLTRLAMCGLLATVTLSGCGQQSPKPKPLPQASGGRSSSSAPQAAPTLPPAARENSKAGAEAFTRHFVATLNYAGTTGRFDEFRHLSADSCHECSSFVTNIGAIYRRGGRIEGGEFAITQLRTLPQGHRNSWVSAAFIKTTSQRIYKGGRVSKRVPPERNVFNFKVQWQDGGWRTMGWTTAH